LISRSDAEAARALLQETEVVLSLELSGAAWVQEEEFHAKTLRCPKVLAHSGTFLPSPFACRPPSMLLNKKMLTFPGLCSCQHPLLSAVSVTLRKLKKELLESSNRFDFCPVG
jgi:hypothetical protein